MENIAELKSNIEDDSLLKLDEENIVVTYRTLLNEIEARSKRMKTTKSHYKKTIELQRIYIQTLENIVLKLSRKLEATGMKVEDIKNIPEDITLVNKSEEPTVA